MKSYKSKPVVIEAIQWNGGDTSILESFLPTKWTRAVHAQVDWIHDDLEKIIVWNDLERIWIPCPVGHWIIKGTKGEFYPCAPDVFKAKYEEA